MKKSIYPFLIAAGIFVGSNVHADFGVELRTTRNNDSTDPAVRLYNAGAPSGPGVDPSESGSIVNPAENDPLWLVFDVDGDGIFNPGALDGVTYDGTVTDLIARMIDADDLVYRRMVNSALEGRTIQNIVGIAAEAQTGGTGSAQRGGVLKNSFTILFDDMDLTNGGTFGFLPNHVAANIPEGGGNALLRIGFDIYADAHTFSTGATPPDQPELASPSAEIDGEELVFSFSFLTESSTTSQIQSTTSLSPPIVWVDEGGTILGNGSVTNVSLTNIFPELPTKFFRVETSR